MSQVNGYEIRLATTGDAFEISMLYHEVYGGTYPDPLMCNVSRIKSFVAEFKGIWVVIENDGKLIGSVVYEVNARHRIGRVFGAVIIKEHRRLGLLEKAMLQGDQYVLNDLKLVDIIYATTRTVTPAPQLVARKLGYKNLGIFPNVRKTDKYETHCLTAKFGKGILDGKSKGYKLHPEIADIYELVKEDCRLPDVEIAATEDYLSEPQDNDIPCLEVIDAPGFVSYRFKQLIEEGKLLSNFLPFNSPNCVLTSPDQEIELFLYLSEVDKYSIIIGTKHPETMNFSKILEAASQMLHSKNSRYIEIIARASKVKEIHQITEADFIPCAYFPAFQLHENKRYDFVVFVKTFEVLNFRGLKFEGLNKDFGIVYYKKWKGRFVKPILEI